MHFVVEKPPVTQTDPVTDVLHGINITDPYRWLEEQDSPRTRQWIAQQESYLRAYFDSISHRSHIRNRVAELLGSKDVVSAPRTVGNRTFFLKRSHDSEQFAIAMREGLHGEDEILLDPCRRGEGPLIAVSLVAVSDDGNLLAYSVRQGGTDHSALEILDIDKNVVLPDRLADGFCTGFAFAPDASGFYYSHRELKDPRPHYRSARWHRFGTSHSQDQEVFIAGEEPNLFLAILDSPEARLLAYIVFSTGVRPHTSLYLHKMQDGAAPTLLLENIEGTFVPFFVQGQLFAYTDVGAPNIRIVRIAPDDPSPSRWKDIVPESDRRIQQFGVAGKQIFVTRVDRFSTHIETFDTADGARKVLPSFPHGTITIVNSADRNDNLFCSCESITQPSALYCYNTSERALRPWHQPEIGFDPSLIAIEQTSYLSKDGTSIPLLLACRKDRLYSGPLPAFLTGYGGFGNCVTPRFTAFATFLIEQGMLFAVPALRGGAELGEKWHRAGQRENRQKSFDDFIAAAEWLVLNGRAAQDRIAIGGGSNAGLLVGAVITQRPDLFRAAICLGPLLDMTRYHLFDFAAGWADEYGSPENEQDLHSLLAYSPYHHVQDGADYPAVLLISGDADTRCNPMHARKMAARLQAANRSEHPILLDYRANWGHTPVQPLGTRIDALTDRLAFLCHELQVEIQPRRSS
jgi:prolyl oligopeptidase